MMKTKGYSNTPSTLFECITFIARALPVRSVPTFSELLIGGYDYSSLFCDHGLACHQPCSQLNCLLLKFRG
jgi:hypothetical protein